MSRSTASDERGSALILALAMLVFVAVIEVVSLSYATSSLSSSNTALAPARIKADDAESAIQTAIRYVAADRAMGGTIGVDLGLPCPTQTLAYAGASGPVSVAICPLADSLIHAGGFRAVLLTLGTDPSEGIVLGHNGDVNIGGAIFSNSILSLANPTTLRVTGGPVWAWGNCTRAANVFVTAPTASAICDASAVFAGVRPKVALDPADPSLGHVADWQPALPASLVMAPAIPACASAKATLSPGVYTDAAALSSLTTSCANVTLSPGAYVLDFASAATPWTISQTVTASCDVSGQGAQIVFANQSKMSLTGALVIPCGRSATATGPKIALYAARTPIASVASITTLRPATATDTGLTKFFTAATLARATPAGSVTYPTDAPATNAQAVVASNAKTAELTLAGFSAASSPPLVAGATISSIVVRVAHDEKANPTFTPVPKLVWGTCSANLSPIPSVSTTAALYSSGSLASAFSACPGFDPTLAPSLVWDVKTTNASSQTIDVDGAEVAVTWVGPPIPAQTGCMATVGGCSVIDPGANSGELNVSDIVYIPQDKLAGKFNLSGALSLGTAVIARAVDIDVNPNICMTCAEIGNDTAAPMPGDVVLDATIATSPWISARVAYTGPVLALVPRITTWANRR